MACKDCRFWQGNRTSEWADCHRVIEKLEPNLLSCYMEIEDKPDIEFYFNTPFDPHDVKYWKHHSFFMKLYKNICNPCPPGVKVVEIKEDDIVYNNEGGESIRPVTIKYIQTHKDFDCEVIDEDK